LFSAWRKSSHRSGEDMAMAIRSYSKTWSIDCARRSKKIQAVRFSCRLGKEAILFKGRKYLPHRNQVRLNQRQRLHRSKPEHHRALHLHIGRISQLDAGTGSQAETVNEEAKVVGTQKSLQTSNKRETHFGPPFFWKANSSL